MRKLLAIGCLFLLAPVKRATAQKVSVHSFKVIPLGVKGKWMNVIFQLTWSQLAVPRIIYI
ncbi:hypothetical protein [Flavihumibacter fluvii]|uniref:hypothetical protein n=1 Tax=Flavihumibacter fluvii TaxID=2838157 RepID=UPI001BDE91A3|nr:hypothetical protein [Flavihumibacter fluvii]ULQ54643.1 hypothetical protein KJS93_09960 [Flavihumibacter fluvii]